MNENADQTILGFPLNRIVAFAGPYIAVASGVVADWLLVHVHFLALFHTTHTQASNLISQGLVFGLTAVLVWLGHQQWLKGHHIILANTTATMNGYPVDPADEEIVKHDQDEAGEDFEEAGANPDGSEFVPKDVIETPPPPEGARQGKPLARGE